ncbi:MAG: hypothetical protein EOO51_00180 [Flavobacterium sp.]|nr:MAG: hypothetical protein EOO51_00180 [Flavobacterium sp.]
MALKLFTIGDSISQGFMSGAAAKTNQSYSTLLAKILGAELYNFPMWGKDGLPVNLETVITRLQRRLDTNISGPVEWIKALSIINAYLDEVEDYYERGAGCMDDCLDDKFFHNVSVRGFDVSNSWQLTPDLCRQVVNESDQNGDNIFGMVSKSLQRTAYRVLGSGAPRENRSQIDWLEYHHKREGVENLILWLGANNCLGTVTNLKIKQTSSDGTAFLKGPDRVSYRERIDKDWNLWHPEDFRVEYQFMIDKVIEIMQDNPHEVDYKVFIGTIPLVTICPLIKSVEKFGRNDRTVVDYEVNKSNPAPLGIAELPSGVERDISYGKYYPYFLFEDNFDITVNHLNQNEILHIDNCIRKYNRIIQEIVAVANERIGTRRFYLVDISTALSQMALKRNDYNPTYKFPEYFEYCYPRVDSRYYGVTRDGSIKSGGLFSLDGVHPTAIGQGLLAYEFLKVMHQAGSFTDDPETAINWKEIFQSDTLYTKPVGLLGEIYDNTDLKKWVYKIISGSWEHKKI